MKMRVGLWASLMISLLIMGCNRSVGSFYFEGELAPDRVLINEEIYKESRELFILKNGDQENRTTISTYNTKEKKIVNQIYEMKDAAGRIRDWVISDEMMAFSTLFMRGESLYIGIYYYHFETQNLKEIRVWPVAYVDLHSIQLVIDNTNLAWLEHSIEARKTRIYHYDLEGATIGLLKEFDFTVEGFQFASFVLAYDQETLYYDYRTDENFYLTMMDGVSGKDYFQVELPKAVVLHNYLRVNNENNFFVLVGKSSIGNILYWVDRVGMMTRELELFPQTKMINDEMIATVGNSIYYVVEEYASDGNSQYYLNKYDLDLYQKEVWAGVFGFSVTDTYIGKLLKTGEVKNPVELRIAYRAK